MIYVGIDVSSQKHNCCIRDECKKILSEFVFTNNRTGFNYLLSQLRKFGTAETTKIGLESTGVYSLTLTVFLRRNGFEVYTFNPLSIKKHLSANTLRKTKTDKADARFLAQYTAQSDSQPDVGTVYHISELKSLSRARFSIVQRASQAKVKAIGLLTVLFPEYCAVFSDCFGASSIALLKRYPSAKDLACADKEELGELLRTASRGRFKAEKAEELIALAKDSVGVYSAAYTMELSFLLCEIENCNFYISKMEKEIKRIMDKIDSKILTVPGIGYILGAMILGEIGDIRRFSSPAKLLAFAGLDPSVYQSGKYVPSSGKMVKRGSPYLRWALTQAATLASFHSNLFGNYLQKKLGEHKSFRVAVSHTAKKLIRVLFAILNNNSVFIDSSATKVA